VLPLDDLGNVREEKVLELEAAWIKNLSALFRRLPDDRYRIYLILESGEARRVLDVIVKGGRPFEPEEARPAITPAPMPQTPAGSEPPGASGPEAPASKLPKEPLLEIEAVPELELGSPAGEVGQSSLEIHPGHAGRLFLSAAAAAALIASRRGRGKWEDEIDHAAEEISARPPLVGSRWWRFARGRQEVARS
jgi:hypothetical protein